MFEYRGLKLCFAQSGYVHVFTEGQERLFPQMLIKNFEDAKLLIDHHLDNVPRETGAL